MGETAQPELKEDGSPKPKGPMKKSADPTSTLDPFLLMFFMSFPFSFKVI